MCTVSDRVPLDRALQPRVRVPNAYDDVTSLRFGFNETSNLFEDIHLVWFGPILVRDVPTDYKERLEQPLQTHPHDLAAHAATTYNVLLGWLILVV